MPVARKQIELYVSCMMVFEPVLYIATQENEHTAEVDEPAVLLSVLSIPHDNPPVVVQVRLAPVCFIQRAPGSHHVQDHFDPFLSRRDR